MGDDPPRAGDLEPGADEEQPYDSDEIDEYPAWWRENIEAFRAHGMRPYRPSRFADGVIVHSRIDALEDEIASDIRLRAIDPHERDSWEVRVDDVTVTVTERRRHGDGYSVFEISSDRFERLVRDAASE
jgi:hypothetical protein